jgi:hypothetical protein
MLARHTLLPPVPVPDQNSAHEYDGVEKVLKIGDAVCVFDVQPLP